MRFIGGLVAVVFIFAIIFAIIYFAGPAASLLPSMGG